MCGTLFFSRFVLLISNVGFLASRRRTPVRRACTLAGVDDSFVFANQKSLLQIVLLLHQLLSVIGTLSLQPSTHLQHPAPLVLLAHCVRSLCFTFLFTILQLHAEGFDLFRKFIVSHSQLVDLLVGNNGFLLESLAL